MSKRLRIGLVAEGPLDAIVIKAALDAFLPPYTLSTLQPESTNPRFGGGWGGVLKWCHEVRKRNPGSLTDDPLLANIDVLILHLDGDVAYGSYSDCGSLPAGDHGWRPLPCSSPCPPAKDTCDNVAQTLRSWLGTVDPGNRTVFCVPAMSGGAWLAAAILPAGHRLLSGCPECELELEDSLGSLKKSHRIKKCKKDYDAHAKYVTDKWVDVRSMCSQAERFQSDMAMICNSLIADGQC